MENNAVYRILDANINRLREALRVVEEYFRLGETGPGLAIRLKTLRHSLKEIEQTIGRGRLLTARDTLTDPLAVHTRPEELSRDTAADVLAANFKRAQEAARVLEEYSKACGSSQASAKAKEIRFELYEIEKKVMETGTDG
jgi:thiamine-phosphate pyrophosphorylase